MKPEEIAIVKRITPIDFEFREYGLNSVEKLASRYQADGKSEETARRMIAEKEYKSKAQKEFLNELIEHYKFSPNQIYRIDEDSLKDKIKDYKAVISFGGDDTQTRVSHVIDGIPLIGLRADNKSLGKTLYYNRENFCKALEKIKNNEYEIEEWPRLEATVNGKQFARATAHYCLSAPFANKHMTRFTIYKNKKLLTPEKGIPGSGILVWTGAGSTGQPRSATWYFEEHIKPFKPTERKATWAVQDPYSPDKHPFEEYGLDALFGEIKEDDEMLLVSKCKTIDHLLRKLKLDPGHMTADSLEDAFFKEGTEIKMRLSKNPLRVIYIPEISAKNKKWC